MNKKIIFAIFMVSLFAIVGCDGGDTGGMTTPFLGGTTGVFIEFADGSPPNEVTDGGTFDFDVLVSLRNDGEFDIDKDDVKVSLLGILAEDFGSSLDELKEQEPDEELTGRSRDTEGNIIEGIPIFVRFPPEEDEHLSYAGGLVGDRKDFTFRANVCYRYQTTGMAQYCVLRDLVNPRENAICDPTGSRSIYSSGAPVQLANFKQSVAGRDKIGLSFDIVHRGGGYVFEYSSSNPAATCPTDTSTRRSKEDRVSITVDPGLGSITCSGLDGNSGFVKLSNGMRSIFCTLTLSSDRSDFEKELEITLDYNYEDDRDTVVLVKHLID